MKKAIVILIIGLFLITCQKEKTPGYEQDLEFVNHTLDTLEIHLYSGTGFILAPDNTYIYGNDGLLPNVWQTEFVVYKVKNRLVVYYITGIVNGRNEIW